MDYNKRQQVYQTLTDLAYFIIIGLVSLVSVIFLPMLNSSIRGGWIWPTSPTEWAIWIAVRVAVALINIIIFYCFTKQAIVNIKDCEEYKRANELMHKINKKKGLLPRSPGKFLGWEWGLKGSFILLGSLGSAIVLAEAVLSFDLTQFLVYLFTIGMGVVCGYITMRKHESYWSTEYPAYAEYLYEQLDKDGVIEPQEKSSTPDVKMEDTENA